VLVFAGWTVDAETLGVEHARGAVVAHGVLRWEGRGGEGRGEKKEEREWG